MKLRANWAGRALMLLLVLVAGLRNAAAEEVPPLYPVEAFAKLPMIMQPQLSPNGKFIAYITSSITGRKTLIAHPIEGMTKDKMLVMPHIDNADIIYFLWANNDVLLVAYSLYEPNPYYRGTRIEQTRLLAANFNKQVYNLVKPSREQKRNFSDPTTTRPQRISFAASQTNIIDLLPDDPDHFFLAIDSEIRGLVDVRKIEVSTGNFKIVQHGRKNIYDWITDADHNVALGYSVYDEKPHLYISKDHRDTWSYDGIYALLEKDFIPVEIEDGNQTAVFIAKNKFGRESLGRFDLRSGSFVEWIYSHELYDINNLVTSSSTGKIIGTGYTDLHQNQVFFTKKERRILASVNRALPGTQNQLFSSDKPGSFWLVRSSKPNTIPTFYSLNWEEKHLAFFAVDSEIIDDNHVAPVKMRKVTMRDGLEIEVYVTMPLGRGSQNLPAVLLPHGGPWARDAAGYDSWAQLFANRGYVVLQPNFRGSTGYGRVFEDLGTGQWGKAMQDDLTDTVNWAVDQGITDPDRVCIVGGSYGGYAAMMGVVKTPDQFKCAISMNGVIDLPLLWKDDRDFLFYKRFREKLGEERKDLKSISPYHRADEITKPVLLIAAKDDWRVNYKHSKNMYKKLKSLKKPVEYLELKTGGHGIDVDANRIKWFKAMDDFIAKHLGPGGPVDSAPSR